MVLGIHPTIDYAFKRMLGDPMHLNVPIHLLNAIFEGRFRVSGVEIQTPFLEKDFAEDKLAILDLCARDSDGRIYNIEMQTTAPACLANRLAYYLSSMYCGQLREGDDYGKLAPAICICFLNEPMLESTSSFHTTFQMCSLEERLILTEHLEIHLIELPKYNGTIADLGHARPIEQWAYFLRHAAEMTPADIAQYLPNPAFAEAGGILDMIAKSPDERLLYDLRTKAARDQISNLAAAHEKGVGIGLEKGMEKGIGIGMEKGAAVGRIQLLQQLLGDTISTAADLRTSSNEQLAVLELSLQTRLRARS